MGFALSWLAIRRIEKPDIYRRLGFAETSARDMVPDAPFAGVTLNTGWQIVIAGHRCDFADSVNLAALSQDCDVVTCAVEEHVMYSHASSWRDGSREWSVSHDSEKGLRHLAADGDPPPIFATIRQEAFDELDSNGGDASRVDYVFDVPVELARHLTGFSHDQDPPTDDGEPFVALKPGKGTLPKAGRGCVAAFLGLGALIRFQ